MPPSSRKRAAPGNDHSSRHESLQEENDGYGEDENSSSGSVGQLAKALVRYALACEYARVTIRRPDVNHKVLGTHSRMFRQVFGAANSQLLDTFGMEMVELPNREKTTIRQKRAAAASEAKASSSSQWVLRNALPAQFGTPNIMKPPQIPTSEQESAYVGLYTLVITLIALSGGVLSEGKMDRFLKRMNANQSTPVDSTDEVLKKMAKEGYIVKVKDASSGDDVTDYYVGPRGKVEVNEQAMAKMVRTVYGGEAMEDLDQRIDRSLGIVDRSGAQSRAAGAGAGAGAAQTQGTGRRASGRARRREDADGDDE